MNKTDSYTQIALNILLISCVLIGLFNAAARNIDRYMGVQISSNFFLDAQWQVFSTMFLIGIAFQAKNGKHIQIDKIVILKKELLDKILEKIFYYALLVPFFIAIIYSSFNFASRSIMLSESSYQPNGISPVYIKSLIPIAFLLTLIGVILSRKKPKK